MIEVSSCVICDGEIRRVREAMVAPFLARRVWDRPPFGVDLVQCQACGFLFYNPRLDASEEGRLYAGYRSEEYRRMRHASEPWYTVGFNAALASPGSYERRRRTLAAILRRHIANREIKRVLDYGGGRGDLVRGLVDGAEAFVYDISAVAAVDGVTPTADPGGCQADLIINSNVLEHVGFPRRIMEEMLQAAPAGALVFLEVPCESPLGWAMMVRRIAQVGIMAMTRPGLAGSIVRPSSVYMMHEHVNYFTERSLITLARSCGCVVIAAGSDMAKGRSGINGVAWCLGTAA